MVSQTCVNGSLQEAVGIEDALDKFAESAVATLRVGHDVHFSLDVAGGVVGRSAYAHLAEQREVIDVIADESHVVERDAELVAECRGCGYFVFDAEETVVYLQLLGTASDDRCVFASHDCYRDTELAEEDDAPSVFDAEALHHVAVGSVVHSAISHYAVDVSYY